MTSIRPRMKYGSYLVFVGAIATVCWALIVLNHYRQSWNALDTVQLRGGSVIYEWQVDRDGRVVYLAEEAAPSRSIIVLVLGKDPRLDHSGATPDLGRIDHETN